MARTKGLISTVKKGDEYKPARIRPEDDERVKRTFQKREFPAQREERRFFFKNQFKKYETTIKANMHAMKCKIAKMDFDTLDNNKTLDSLVNYAQEIINETQRIEEIGKTHYVVSYGGVKMHWVHPIYKDRLIEHMQSKYKVSEIWTMNKDEKNRFYNYTGQKCVVVPKYEEGLHLETMITNVPIHVFDGQRYRLFTPHCMVVVSEEPPSKVLDKRMHDFMVAYIKSEWYPKPPMHESESDDFDRIFKEEPVSDLIPTQTQSQEI